MRFSMSIGAVLLLGAAAYVWLRGPRTGSVTDEAFADLDPELLPAEA
jgi:hypothetical protein